MRLDEATCSRRHHPASPTGRKARPRRSSAPPATAASPTPCRTSRRLRDPARHRQGERPFPHRHPRPDRLAAAAAALALARRQAGRADQQPAPRRPGRLQPADGAARAEGAARARHDRHLLGTGQHPAAVPPGRAGRRRADRHRPAAGPGVRHRDGGPAPGTARRLARLRRRVRGRRHRILAAHGRCHAGDGARRHGGAPAAAGRAAPGDAAATRRAHRPSATVATIEAATATVTALGARAEALRQALEQARPAGAGASKRDKAGDDHRHLSSRPAEGADQETKSTPVENHVRTDQGSGRTPAKGWDGALAADDPAAPLLFGRWLADYAGHPTALQRRAGRARDHRPAADQALGCRAPRLQRGRDAARSGPGDRRGLPRRRPARGGAGAQQGGLLVSLLRRPPGQLTPETFHRRPPADPELGTDEALGIAARHAPSHRPHWVLERWHDTRSRKGERIHHPQHCLAAFASKLEREQGRGSWAA